MVSSLLPELWISQGLNTGQFARPRKGVAICQGLGLPAKRKLELIGWCVLSGNASIEAKPAIVLGVAVDENDVYVEP